MATHEDGDEELLWLIKRAYYGQRQLIEAALRPHGITAAQAGVLSKLISEPGLSGSDLGRRLLITAQAVQSALVSLERGGLVVRRPDRDNRRILRSFLTEEGRRAAELCVAEGLTVLDKPLSDFDAHERRALEGLLRRLVENLSR